MSIRVLIVDDHAVVRAGLRMLLAAEEDIEPVGEAGRAKEAVFQARSLEPDVILMDVVMPDGSGIDAVPQLLHEHPEVKVLVLSMQDDPHYVRQAFSSGASGYVLKEAADTEVVGAIREVARGGRYVHPALGARLVSADADERRRAEADPLSEREREVLRLLALGHTNQEIAKMLYISVRTAETHRAHIMQKLGLQTRAELVRHALDEGLLETVWTRCSGRSTKWWTESIDSPIGRIPSARSRSGSACRRASRTCCARKHGLSSRGRKVRDVTVLAADEAHIGRIVAAVRTVDGIEVEHVSDRTFLLHLGGKVEVVPKTPLKTRDDLSMAYTPGVARVCRAIADDPGKVWNLTVKQNAVAVVTDGTAVLGLGDIGPEAALPVMEGKAILFKELGGIDAWPICLATTDPDEIVRTVIALAPVFGGINLEDIAAPRCFEIESRLRDALDIPVFHDDQHGTAIVVLAALLNSLEVVGKQLADVRVVVTGAGAAGAATARMLLVAGATDVVCCDRHWILCPGRTDLDPFKTLLAAESNPRALEGSADDALAGADVFIGLSGPGAVSAEGVRSMAEAAIVFGWPIRRLRWRPRRSRMQLA